MFEIFIEKFIQQENSIKYSYVFKFLTPVPNKDIKTTINGNNAFIEIFKTDAIGCNSKVNFLAPSESKYADYLMKIRV